MIQQIQHPEGSRTFPANRSFKPDCPVLLPLTVLRSGCHARRRQKASIQFGGFFATSGFALRCPCEGSSHVSAPRVCPVYAHCLALHSRKTFDMGLLDMRAVLYISCCAQRGTEVSTKHRSTTLPSVGWESLVYEYVQNNRLFT